MAADVVWSVASDPVFEIVGRSTPGGVKWAWARQDLDMMTAPRARAELAAVSSETGRPDWVLVYLGAEIFVDLRGLEVLLDVAAQVRAGGGELVVVSPPHCLCVMITMLGLKAALPLAATAPHAAREMRLRRCAHRAGGRRGERGDADALPHREEAAPRSGRPMITVVTPRV
jgi:anti-anti-sigma factor